MNLLSFSVYITAYFGLFVSAFFLLTFFGNRDKIKDPIPKTFPFVSFVIPVYNEEKVISQTIKSLLKVNYPKDKYEIIIIDDGSTDNTYKEAKTFESSRVKIFRKENGGCASALNFGLRKARGEIIARFDADSTLDKNSLNKIVGYFGDENVMAVTSSLNVLNHRGFMQKIQWAEYFMGIFLRKIFDFNNAIHIIPGPLSVYRSEYFAKHGGFDEANITEDTEMAMRMQSHGYTIRNSMGAMVYTITPTKFSQLNQQRIRWYTGFMRNSYLYTHLFNAKRKNDLSILILPASYITILLTFFSLFVLLYYNINAIYDWIVQLSVTGFDIVSLIRNIKIGNILELLYNYATSQYVFFLISGILLMASYFIITKYYSGEKRGIFTAFLLFMLFYFVLFAYWWTLSVFYMVTGKGIKWGKKEYSRGIILKKSKHNA
jgi:cellulose synthase/poly-beta-1,6-N-acetylglucosamine synthase-like glycosyltransferase